MARLLLAAVLAAAGTARAQFALHLLDLGTHPMAQCLDGSPGGFYYAPGSGSGANSWIIHTQGG